MEDKIETETPQFTIPEIVTQPPSEPTSPAIIPKDQEDSNSTNTENSHIVTDTNHSSDSHQHQHQHHHHHHHHHHQNSGPPDDLPPPPLGRPPSGTFKITLSEDINVVSTASRESSLALFLALNNYRKRLFGIFVERGEEPHLLEFWDSAREFQADPNIDKLTKIVQNYYLPDSQSKIKWAEQVKDQVIEEYESLKGSMSTIKSSILSNSIKECELALELSYMKFCSSESTKLTYSLEGINNSFEWLEKVKKIHTYNIFVFYSSLNENNKAFLKEWDLIEKSFRSSLQSTPKASVFILTNDTDENFRKRTGILGSGFRPYIHHESDSQFLKTLFNKEDSSNQYTSGVVLFNGENSLFSWEGVSADSNTLKYPDPVDILNILYLNQDGKPVPNNAVYYGNPLTGEGWNGVALLDLVKRSPVLAELQDYRVTISKNSSNLSSSRRSISTPNPPVINESPNSSPVQQPPPTSVTLSPLPATDKRDSILLRSSTNDRSHRRTKSSQDLFSVSEHNRDRKFSVANPFKSKKDESPKPKMPSIVSPRQRASSQARPTLRRSAMVPTSRSDSINETPEIGEAETPTASVQETNRSRARSRALTTTTTNRSNLSLEAVKTLRVRHERNSIMDQLKEYELSDIDNALLTTSSTPAQTAVSYTPRQNEFAKLLTQFRNKEKEDVPPTIHEDSHLDSSSSANSPHIRINDTDVEKPASSMPSSNSIASLNLNGINHIDGVLSARDPPTSTTARGGGGGGGSGGGSPRKEISDFAAEASAQMSSEFISKLKKLKITPMSLLNLKKLLNASIPFLYHFISNDGLKHLVDNLIVKNKGEDTSEKQKLIMDCLESAMTSKEGWKSVIYSSNGLYPFVKIMLSKKTDLKVKIMVMDLLAACCLIPPDGATIVMQAFKDYATKKKEYIFYTFAKSLRVDNIDYLVSAFAFINCIVNAPEDLETRIQNRQYLLNLGLIDIINYFRDQYIDGDLHIQMDVFEDEMDADAAETEDRLRDAMDKKSMNPRSMYELLEDSVKGTTYYTDFIMVIRHLFELNTDVSIGRQVWKIVDHSLKYITEMRESNPDLSNDELFNTFGKKGKVSRLRTAITKPKTLAKDPEDFEEEIKHLKNLLSTLSADNALLRDEIEKLKKGKDKSKKKGEPESTDTPATVAPVAPLGSPSTPVASTPDQTTGAIVAPAPTTGGGPPPPPPPGPGGRGPPPPPPGPGGRGPPPPPGAPQAGGLPKLPNKAPRIKMKQINWVKIVDRNIPNTLWTNLNKSSINLNIDLLEELFAAQQASKIKEKEEDPNQANKKQVVSLIDPKRGKNCAIMLQSRFKKLTFEEIHMAMVKLDEKVLTPSDVTALIEFVPTPDEIELITTYNGGVEDLAPPERYFLTIKNLVPKLQKRLKCFEFKLSFEERVSDLHPHVQAAYHAIKQIKGSEKLKILFRLILDIGNYMNGGGARGGAYGFKFNTLSKLKDTKSLDNSKHLLHFIIMQLESTMPNLLNDVSQELPQVALATRISMEMLRPRLVSLKSGVAELTEELKTFTPIDASDPFKNIMAPFLDESSKRVTLIDKDFERLEAEYKSLVKLWDDDEKNLEMSLVFTTINDFISDLKFCKQEMDKQREEALKEKLLAEKKAEARKRMEQNATTSGAASGVPTTPGPSSSSIENDEAYKFGNMTNQIRTGNIWQKRAGRRSVVRPTIDSHNNNNDVNQHFASTPSKNITQEAMVPQIFTDSPDSGKIAPIPIVSIPTDTPETKKLKQALSLKKEVKDSPARVASKKDKKKKS
eukprot:TRINITY_DN1470_c0_g1_i2.p1 TRINITY_DN1470_c0_g1~~TRINITY_DN1470_c0_g1_i2.p1  ORF type:complete len:1792 (+),score=498.11 TRINITY_DN1470_c0_g1_i2:58-5376(+)